MPTRSERRELDLVALEDRVAKEATAELRKKLEAITRHIDLYRESNTGTRELMRGGFVKALTEVANDDEFLVIAETIREGAREAYIAGIEQAAEDAGRNATDFLSPVPRELFELGQDAADKAREEIEEAVRRLERAEDPDDVEEAVLRAHRGVTTVERNARWGVNRGLSSGVDEVVTATGMERLWIGERDACVHCAAYIGERATAGLAFPGGLTYGAKPLSEDPVRNPPLHPNCRCRIRFWRPEDGDDLPDALKREALRSILRGWSLPSESERTRLLAADRALKHLGRDMPKSVQDYARRAIRTGKFPKGRDFGSTQAAVKESPKKRTPSVKKDAEPVPVTTTAHPFDSLPRKSGEITDGMGTPGRPALDDEFVDLYGWKSGDAELNADVRFTNPNYDEPRTDKWKINCQRVTVAYELRRRGYLVEAMPNVQRSASLGPSSKKYPWSVLSQLWHRPDRWLIYDSNKGKLVDTAEGTPNARHVPGGPADWQRPPTREDLLRIVAEWPPGARGWLGGSWKGGSSAHIWNVEVKADGRILFVDAQPRIAGYKVTDYLKDIEPGTFHLLRVDNLEPEDDEMVSMVRKVDPKTGEAEPLPKIPL
jgi:hypothetical protein